MSIVNDLKKLFFGATSITKSAAEKTGDFVAEEGADILNKGKDFIETAGETVLDKTEGLGGLVKDKTSSAFEITKDKLMDVGDDLGDNPMVQKAGDGLSRVGEKLGDITESVGKTVMDKGGDAMEKAGDISESVGEKVLDVKDKVMEKAGEVGDKIKDKYEETSIKAEEWAKEEAAKPKREFAEKDLDAGGSLLDGTDDFFSKADQYADGDYDAFSEGKVKVEDVDLGIEDVKSEVKNLPPLAGFNDADGDGSDLIDDAEISD